MLADIQLEIVMPLLAVLVFPIVVSVVVSWIFIDQIDRLLSDRMDHISKRIDNLSECVRELQDGRILDLPGREGRRERAPCQDAQKVGDGMKTKEQIPRKVYRVVRKKDDTFIAEATVIAKNRSWYTFQQGDNKPFRENGMNWYETIRDAAYSFFLSEIRLHKVLSGSSDVSEQTKDDVWAIVGELLEWGKLAGEVEAMQYEIKRAKEHARASNPVQQPDGAGDSRQPQDADAADHQGGTDR